MITFEEQNVVVQSDIGRVIFRPMGYRQYEIILEFNTGAGKEALDMCREGLDYLFTQTNTLIVRGYIKSENSYSRVFGNALGFSTIKEEDGVVEKRMTITRWNRLND